MANLVFFGSNSYSVLILESLLGISDFQLQAVVTKPDAKVGRQQIITQNPVAEFATNHQLPLLQPINFDQDFVSKFQAFKPDLALCVAYGPPFFTPKMCHIPTNGIINLHPSPLPKYRGAAPGPWQIINGETNSALTFFLIDELPDHGPIVAQIPFSIQPNDTSSSFYNRAFGLGANNLEKILKQYLANPTAIQAQDHSQKTYFPKLTKDSGKIDWSKPADYNQRFIQAMQPWPLAWCQVKTQSGTILKMQILTSRLENGKLTPLDVKIEGKPPTKWSSFQNYYQILTS